MEKIATDISSFENLRKDGFVYVDKTDLLWRLVALREGRQFFISRPRRFGKSLMISTLKAIFEGKRELFKGLKIDRMRYDWKTYPVVHLDMSEVKGETPDELKHGLFDTIDGLVRSFGLAKVRRPPNLGRYFANFLKALVAARGPYVVLIDEYDVPIQGFLDDRRALVRARGILHDFYSRLKSHSDDIRFLMLTGVTKLTKLSVFSGLNQLNDLTMSKRYATLFGYEPKEIAASFPVHLKALGKALKTDAAGALRGLQAWYDSYRFSPLSTRRVCNPISVGKALSARELQSYWVRTATAALIMERMEETLMTPKDFEGCTASVSELDVCDALTLPVKALMYQGGYLTIKGLSKTEKDEIGKPRLVLGAPNHEVRGAIRAGWFEQYAKMPAADFEAIVDVAKRQLAAGDVDGLVNETLYRVYAKVPTGWKIRTEADAKRHFGLFMEMLGAKVAAETASARGVADAVIETKRSVWVFEFKFNKSAKAAVRQIRAKGYADAYRGDRRAVTLVGVNFSGRKRNIDEPVFEPLDGAAPDEKGV